MDQRGEKYIYVPRPHQETQSLVDRVLIRKIGTHEHSRDEEYDEQQQAEDEVLARHRRLAYTLFGIPVSTKFSKHQDLTAVVSIVRSDEAYDLGPGRVAFVRD